MVSSRDCCIVSMQTDAPRPRAAVPTPTTWYLPASCVPDDKPQGFRVHQQDRTNSAMARIIEQGIERDLLHGSVLAWKFMASHAIPDELIARVLAHPTQRRRSDTPSARSGESGQPS
jgi:hypothetical protein